MQFPIFDNSRSIMRKMNLSDANDIFEYCSDSDFMRYTGSPAHKRLEDTEKMFLRYSSSFLEGKGIAWAIAAKSTNKVIGNIGLYDIGNNKDRAFASYNISTSYQNQGIATWALTNCLQYGLNELHIKRIEAKCKSVNLASERVMQKCGMLLYEVKKSPFLVDGIYYDIKTYYICR